MAKNETAKKIEPTDPTAPVADSTEAEAVAEAARKTARSVNRVASRSRA